MKYLPLPVLFLSLLLACTPSRSGKTEEPKPNSAKEAVFAYVESLRSGDCERALSLVGGPLKSVYDRMIASSGIEMSCAGWRDKVIPAHKVVYAYDELKDDRTIVWMKLFRKEMSPDPIWFEVKMVEGEWRIVGL